MANFKGVKIGRIIRTPEDLMAHSYPLAGPAHVEHAKVIHEDVAVKGVLSPPVEEPIVPEADEEPIEIPSEDEATDSEPANEFSDEDNRVQDSEPPKSTKTVQKPAKAKKK